MDLYHIFRWSLAVDVVVCDVAGFGADSTLDAVGCYSLSRLSSPLSRQSRARLETGLTPTQIGAGSPRVRSGGVRRKTMLYVLWEPESKDCKFLSTPSQGPSPNASIKDFPQKCQVDIKKRDLGKSTMIYFHPMFSS